MNTNQLLFYIYRPSPFQLESYHQNQECSENKHLECVDKSDPIFEKLVPAQKTTTESKSVSANLQDSGLGRKKFRRLSSS
jgi:hypothetical protein